jgi:hypothetical protein
MNIKKLLNKDVKKLDDLKYVKELNKTLIADLYTAAEKDKKDVWGKDKEYIKNFIEGKQWDNNTAPVPQGMAFRGGKPIYYEGLIATFNAESVQSATRPLYSVNLTKSICETLIAKFCEPDPLCRAFSRSDYHYDIELLRKIDLLAYHLMYEENNFKSIYQNVLMEALTQRHSYIWIKWDEKNGKTHIPIKWIFLESDALLIDPNATDINFAEYVIHILKMKYSELKYKYNFKSENENEKNIDNNTIIEVKHWWIRIKIEGKYKWIMIPEYENQFLKILDEDGEAIDVEAHDYLPFTIFKGKPTKLWYGDHFVFDLIPFNMMYNLVVTMEQWNIRKVIDKPWIGTGVKASVVKEGDQPGGFISLPNTANLRGAENVTLVGSTEFLTLKQTIKEEISDIVGDLGILSGNNPPRVYSGKMLESVKEMAELKPRMMEESFWYSISEVFKKSLLCIVQEKQSVSLFDPDFDNGDG